MAEQIAREIASWGVDIFVQFFLPAVAAMVGVPVILLLAASERVGVNVILLTAMCVSALVFVLAVAVIYESTGQLGIPG